jgi:hypothetical protein
MDKKERRRIIEKRYYDKNKQKTYEASLIWKKNNPEKVKKSEAIRNWKRRGIIDGDYETLYNEFLNTKECWICGHDFSKYVKCLDHDHDIIDEPNIRYICCNYCNGVFLNLKCKNFRFNVD